MLPGGDRYTWLVETQPHGGPLMALTLNQWRGQLPDLPSSILVLVPHQPQGWEPLCGFYRRSAQASLQSFQAEGGPVLSGLARSGVGSGHRVYQSQPPGYHAVELQ